MIKHWLSSGYHYKGHSGKDSSSFNMIKHWLSSGYHYKGQSGKDS